jgi:hypothetical protein
MNAVLISLATSVGGGVLLRYITLGRARITSDTEKIARDALTRAQRVFGASSAAGGRLAHPWREGAQEFDCYGLESDLTSAYDRIKNRKLRASLRVVRSEIHGVWAAAYVGRAAVGFPGHQATPGEIAHQRDTERKAELQRRHAEQGTAATKAALAKLGKLAARV